MCGWQPIETAPKEYGFRCLAAWPTGGGAGDATVAEALWDANDDYPFGRWWRNNAWAEQPTHWMPLPPPPTGEFS